ncbi:uncharacterized protein LOC108736346 [Agrilus planipennis]|uniref:Uncharacterized protein LOC108736346 n=1 Tax=Agrilus planipennis TaxID=224129 RepID=A0A1W4WJY6_AGRPL|nr:uncharacterized protein LOC108736346 [Agrilus planipennis]
MTGSQTEIEYREHKTEESSVELSQNENEQSSSYQSEIDISYKDEGEEDTFITEKFIKEHKRNLEKRVNNLKRTIEILRKQLNEEKALWKEEFEEYNKLQANVEDTSTGNLTESSTDNSYLGNGDHQQKFPLQQDSSSFIQKQAEQKAILWRTIAMAEYQRRLLEVESMCNLELIRVKQSVQSLQPLQRLVSEWSDQTTENSNKSEEIASTKSTVTIGTENDDISDNTKESKSDEEIKMDKEAVLPISPRSKIYNDFSEVCAKMQNFMVNLPITASVLASKDPNSAKTQSAVWYSAYSFH